MSEIVYKPQRDPRVAARTFEGETVIIDPDRNVVCMLNEVGSRIWELADGTRTSEEIAHILTEEFEVDNTHAWYSTTQFLSNLKNRRILTLVPQAQTKVS